MADPRDDVPSPPGSPLPDIQRALDEQYTDDIRDLAHRYAERRATLVCRAGRPIPKNYAQELVHDAMVSLWLGTRRWDPQRMTLFARLCSIIKDRTWHEAKSAQRHQHVAFDLVANDTSLGVEVEASLVIAAASSGDCSPIRLATLTRQVVDELKPLARKDEEARAILGCWEQGFIERDEVLAVTRLSETEYDAARQRILRLAKRLPPDLREAAHDLLRSAS